MPRGVTARVHVKTGWRDTGRHGHSPLAVKDRRAPRAPCQPRYRVGDGASLLESQNVRQGDVRAAHCARLLARATRRTRHHRVRSDRRRPASTPPENSHCVAVASRLFSDPLNRAALQRHGEARQAAHLDELEEIGEGSEVFAQREVHVELGSRVVPREALHAHRENAIE